MAMMEDDIKSLEVMSSLPYEQLRENLRKVFENYGVSKTNQNRWLDFTDFYCLLDKNGQLSEEGRATMERLLRRSAQRNELCHVHDRLNRESRREDMA